MLLTEGAVPYAEHMRLVDQRFARPGCTNFPCSSLGAALLFDRTFAVSPEESPCSKFEFSALISVKSLNMGPFFGLQLNLSTRNSLLQARIREITLRLVRGGLTRAPDTLLSRNTGGSSGLGQYVAEVRVSYADQGFAALLQRFAGQVGPAIFSDDDLGVVARGGHRSAQGRHDAGDRAVPRG